jgi:hypothetical protein
MNYKINIRSYLFTIISAVTTDLVREEQFVYDMCLLGAVTVEITQILTRAGVIPRT